MALLSDKFGHDIDKLGYDKSPHDPNYFDFYRSEYRKVTRSVDILSNPPTPEGKSQKKETLAAINGQHALLSYVPQEQSTKSPKRSGPL